MATTRLPVVIHGAAGRMGRVAAGALREIAQRRLLRVGGDVIEPVPIGVDVNRERLRQVSGEFDPGGCTAELEDALDRAFRINRARQVYHNTVPTGIRKETLMQAVGLLDAATAAVFMEKPLASNYAEGFAIVEALERRGFIHGVVHDMLEAPGVRRALELIPEIRPLSAHMVFGYEVGPGFSGNRDFFAQRPDFNWTLRNAGGGIILDMSHESYLSEALFGPTERLSAVARLLVPRRLASDGQSIIECDVEDFAALRREHTSGLVNTSIWSWYRRVNSEFGPLEVAVEGERGSIVFGLYGLKIQRQESGPAVRWQRSVIGEVIDWRGHWEYEEVPARNPFVAEWCKFLKCAVTGEKYPLDAVHALNILGEVEAFYESAAADGQPVAAGQLLRYPQPPPDGWKPERLQGKLRHAGA